MGDHVITLPRQLGLRVREGRERQGLSRAQLAMKAGVSERLLASLELGDAPGIRLDKLMCVLVALEMELVVRDAPQVASLVPERAAWSGKVKLPAASHEEVRSIPKAGPSARSSTSTRSNPSTYVSTWQEFLHDQGIDMPARTSSNPWDGGE